MGAFEFKAIDPNGKQHKGVMQGDSARQIRQELRAKNWLPTSVEAVIAKSSQSSQKISTVRRRLSPADLTLFTRQLATLEQSGLPIEEALQACAEQTEKRAAKSMIMEVRSGVLEGHSLAESMGTFPQVFPELYRSTVAAGEHAGHLDSVLERLADYTENRQQMRQKVQMALLYPIILTSLSLLIVAGLLAYVVPSVVEVFNDTGQQLPFLTRTLISVSDLTRDYGLLSIILFAVLYAGFRYSLRNPESRHQFHKSLLKLPLIAKVIKGVETARFARTLSILNASSVPLLEALKIAGSVLGNLAIQNAVVDATERVREGSSLRAALSECGYFPPIALHMIASGETSGELESMLSRVADNQEREFEHLMSTLLGLLGPLMVIAMGGIVLIIVMAILLPIFELNQLIV